jgi:outer membrane protein assembly factor BamB
MGCESEDDTMESTGKGGRTAGIGMLVVLFWAIHAAAAPPPDWPQWRGPNRDAVSNETAWTHQWAEAGPTVAWKADVGTGYSAVSIAAGKLFTMGNVDKNDVVWCLEAATGKVVWKHSYPCLPDETKGHEAYPGPRMTPTVDGDRVYTLSRYGHLFCLGVADGAMRWSTNVQEKHNIQQTQYKWGLASSPVIVGDLVIFDLGGSLAFKKTSGDLAWRALEKKAAFCSPNTLQIDGKTYVTAFNAEEFALLDAATGNVLGKFPITNRYQANIGTPIVVGDKVFISSGYNRGSVLFQATASGLKTIYDKRDLATLSVNPVLYKGHVYGISGEAGHRGPMACIEFETGKVKWTEKGVSIGGGMLVAGGKLLFTKPEGELVVAEASPDGYKELAKAKVLEKPAWTMPVLLDGRIYCRSNGGGLVCLDVRASR